MCMLTQPTGGLAIVASYLAKNLVKNLIDYTEVLNNGNKGSRSNKGKKGNYGNKVSLCWGWWHGYSI